MTRRRVRLGLVVTGLLCIAAPSASADCGLRVINDYFAHGVVSGHYPGVCYAEALAEVTPDAAMYSNVVASIQAAQARDSAATAPSGGSAPAASTPPATTSDNAGTPPSPKRRRPRTPPRPHSDAINRVATRIASLPDAGGPVARLIVSLGPADATSFPTPVIVLVASAGLLLSGGAAGVLTRRSRRRRLGQ